MYRGAVRAERAAKKELEEKAKGEVNRLKGQQARQRWEKPARIAKYGVPFLIIGRHCLKIEHVEQWKELRDNLRAAFPPRRTKRFSDWLKTQDRPINLFYAVMYEDAGKARPPPYSRKPYHPHRAPGFENRKLKHERKDGTFPSVNLSYAVKQECQKALIEARKIEQALAMAQQHRAPQVNLPPLIHAQETSNPQLAYFKHWADIREHITVEDFSRMDAMIALRLRSNGYRQDEVEETIRACAPSIRERGPGRNWRRYAERAVAYAFGYAGDRGMERNTRLWDRWEQVEGLADSSPRHVKGAHLA
ncbi:DNA-primase RepB domain-containing protein [Desulfovibrio sp. ZJ209]|nr:DNA-primase RepB domain-containing protein [Desulfovibrio sp. ZJ209]